MKTIDMKGRPCPQPVVNTKKAIDSGESIFTVIVDNTAACENVNRIAAKLGRITEISEISPGEFHILVKAPDLETRGKTGDEAGAKPGVLSPPGRRGACVYINSRFMGRGEDKLGFVLMRGFLKTLKELDPVPEVLVFVNTGVKLVVEGADQTIPAVRELLEAGSEVLVCGTCLDFFDIKDKLKVGRISNMFEIVETLDQADHVIEP